MSSVLFGDFTQRRMAVSWQPIGPIFKGQEVEEEFLDSYRQVPKRRYGFATIRCVISQKRADPKKSNLFI